MSLCCILQMTKYSHLTSGSLLTFSHRIPFIWFLGHSAGPLGWTQDLYVHGCIIIYCLSQVQTHNFTISIIICWIRNKYLNVKGGLDCRTWSCWWFRTWSRESNYRWKSFSPQQQKEWPRLDVCRGVWVPLSLWRTSLTMQWEFKGPWQCFESFIVTEVSSDGEIAMSLLPGVSRLLTS